VPMEFLAGTGSKRTARVLRTGPSRGLHVRHENHRQRAIRGGSDAGRLPQCLAARIAVPRGGRDRSWVDHEPSALPRHRPAPVRPPPEARTVCSWDSFPAAGTAHPDDLIAFKQRSQSLGNALVVLTPDERNAIEAAFFSELTYAEVAARLNEPLGTIKTRIHSGLHKLHGALAEGGSGGDLDPARQPMQPVGAGIRIFDAGASSR
jgi:RNA polymerase sigma factor (sigma-70 family)